MSLVRSSSEIPWAFQLQEDPILAVVNVSQLGPGSMLRKCWSLTSLILSSASKDISSLLLSCYPITLTHQEVLTMVKPLTAFLLHGWILINPYSRNFPKLSPTGQDWEEIAFSNCTISHIFGVSPGSFISASKLANYFWIHLFIYSSFHFPNSANSNQHTLLTFYFPNTFLKVTRSEDKLSTLQMMTFDSFIMCFSTT